MRTLEEILLEALNVALSRGEDCEDIETDHENHAEDVNRLTSERDRMVADLREMRNRVEALVTERDAAIRSRDRAIDMDRLVEERDEALRARDRALETASTRGMKLNELIREKHRGE